MKCNGICLFYGDFYFRDKRRLMVRAGMMIGFYTALILLTAGSTLNANIYKYIDSEGVIHFTNVPVSSGYEIYIRQKPARALNLYSTAAYDKFISKASKKHGIDSPLIKAMIKVESDFNPRAVSKAGAMGLMQIMPGNFKAFGIKDPFNPLENIMAGACYLKKLMNRYAGKLSLSLAAYNAGPTVVDRYKKVPPIKETQNYVEKVMKYYNLYKRG